MILDPNLLIQIGIGELAVAGGEKIISTVLGSCVSVTLYSPACQIGGMNHFALARRAGEANEALRPFHYGEDAVPALIERVLQETGERPGALIAKIAGGACGLTGTSSQIGQNNIELARALLEQYGIQVAGSHLGGASGRKVLFYPGSGKLLVSLLEDRHAG